MNSAKAAARSVPLGASALRSDGSEVRQNAEPSHPASIQWNGHMCVDDVATSGPEIRANLSATETGLTLKGTLGEFILPAAKVNSVRRAGFYPWFWGGIRIFHSVTGLPKRLQFCPMGMRSRQLLAALKAMGFITE